MKFCKTYQNHHNEQPEKYPVIDYKRLKKTLKKCKGQVHPQTDDPASNLHDCQVCDGIFFISLLEEMSAIVDCFNEKALKLLDRPTTLLGFWRNYLCGQRGSLKENVALVKEGEDLLVYAMVNAIAFRKILKKYDKVHDCEKGRAFKSGVMAKHIEILQSPWLYELMASHLNLRDRKLKPEEAAALFEGLCLSFNDERPSMICQLFDTFKIDVDLNCPICLDIVFDAVALKCGHLLCYMCACSAASVTIVDGLSTAAVGERCPLCREAKVYTAAVRLAELNHLLSKRCCEYWEERLESERVERLRLVKEHWESEYRAFVGV